MHEEEIREALENVSLRLAAVESRQCEILELLQAILAKEEMMANDINTVLADVSAETTVEQSVIALLNSLSAQLAAANVPQATIDSIVGTLQSNTAALSAALAANTQAAPVTPAPAVAALKAAVPTA